MRTLSRLASPSDEGLPELRSGRRCYTCRAFTLKPNAGNGTSTLTALLLERQHTRAAGPSRVGEHFRLTLREAEAAQLVMQGLTNKKIAQRMEVSPNTVKAFLKMVMVKMGVSTRAGVVGKALDLLI